MALLTQNDILATADTLDTLDYSAQEWLRVIYRTYIGTHEERIIPSNPRGMDIIREEFVMPETLRVVNGDKQYDQFITPRGPITYTKIDSSTFNDLWQEFTTAYGWIIHICLQDMSCYGITEGRTS